MNTIHHRQVILAPPLIGPMIALETTQLVQARVGYDDALGRPLLLGALPEACEDPTGVLRCARFTIWQEIAFGKSPSNVGWITFSFTELPPTQGPWLIFFVHAQPPGLQRPVLRSDEPSHFCALDHVLRQHVPLPNHDDPRPGLARAIQGALRRWMQADIGTRPVFPGLQLGRQTGPQAPALGKLPAPSARTRFVLGSCQYPGGMLDTTPLRGQWRASPPDQSMATLHRARMGTSDADLDFVLLVGDQVYLDATAGLFDPALLADRFGAPYKQWLGRPMTQLGLAGVPVHTMLDDHEIADNWEPVNPDVRACSRDGRQTSVRAWSRDLLAKGMISYQTFQGPVTPPSAGLGRPRFWRQIGTSADPQMVFMADTRTRREARNTRTIDAADIMDAAQFDALCHWLQQSGQQPTQPRFIACPSMLLPRRRSAVGATVACALQSDAWDGYPHSLHRLLAALYECRCHNVVLLSGDEHLGSISFIDLTREGQTDVVRVHVVHTPGLYAPFPFANASPDDFITPDDFDFCWPAPADHNVQARYHCHVQTWFPPASNGFVLVDAPHALSPRDPIKVTFMQSTANDAPPPAPMAIPDTALVAVDVQSPT